MHSPRIGQLASAAVLATALSVSSQASAAGELCEKTSGRVNSVFTSQYLDRYGEKAYDVGYRFPLEGGCAPRYGLELSTSLPQPDYRQRAHDLLYNTNTQTKDILSSSLGGFYSRGHDIIGAGIGRGGMRFGFTEHSAGWKMTVFEAHANPINKSFGFSINITH